MRYAILAALLLAGCAEQTKRPPPEPVIKTQTVNVATPVPCPALAKLGNEPNYVDTDAALKAAPDIFEQTRLLLEGRIQRTDRLSSYAAARAACTF